MTSSGSGLSPDQLAARLKEKARQLGFTLVGITYPEPPAHMDTYLGWLAAGRHAGMGYLAEPRAVERRADPGLVLPGCRSILVLGTPYARPDGQTAPGRGRIAAYARGEDYHLVLPGRLQSLVAYLEELAGAPIPNRWYTDTGPLLERELGMRAGLGWIGKNTCLINPQAGSTFLLAEILLGIELPPDEPFTADQCGSCTRCIQACPTGCIQPDRTLDARRCISYLTIENKGDIPEELRPLQGDWVFGCDICQMVCPWNLRFAPAHGDPALQPSGLQPSLRDELALSTQEYNRKYKNSPLKRAKRRGYLRNLAVAAGNSTDPGLLPALRQTTAENTPGQPGAEELIRTHAEWAIRRKTSEEKG